MQQGGLQSATGLQNVMVHIARAFLWILQNKYRRNQKPIKHLRQGILQKQLKVFNHRHNRNPVKYLRRNVARK